MTLYTHTDIFAVVIDKYKGGSTTAKVGVACTCTIVQVGVADNVSNCPHVPDVTSQPPRELLTVYVVVLPVLV